MKIIMILCLVFALQLSATIINIPADQPTIQVGIDVAVEGDTVLVAPGTYFENISILQKDDIHIIGSGADVTTIDGNENGHVVVFNVASGSICDFTITNSGNDPGYSCGVFTSQSSVIIEDDIITYNHGGIFASSSSDVFIHNNKIINNTGYKTIAINSSTGYISYNLIANNLRHGIYNDSWSSVTLLNNTIDGNNENFGVLLKPTVPHIVRNNIITNFALGIYLVSTEQSPVPLVDIAFNDVWNNTAFNYLEEYYIGAYLYSQPFLPQPGTGEINVDPLFMDPLYGDYHLQPDSPCIDAGDPNSPFDPDETITDIGCFFHEQQIGINDNQISNNVYCLSNYPNPFNPTTTISFSIQEDSNVELSIYNIRGQKINSLLNDQIIAGEHSITWNGKDDSGKKVSSGLYLYKLTVNDKTEAVKKCLLLK